MFFFVFIFLFLFFSSPLILFRLKVFIKTTLGSSDIVALYSVTVFIPIWVLVGIKCVGREVGLPIHLFTKDEDKAETLNGIAGRSQASHVILLVLL